MKKLATLQIERYSRQIILDGFGGAAQKKLLAARVFIVGAGGLGSSCAYYLAAAGVGRIIIADSDKVELNNLQRQILHNEKSLGAHKALSAKKTLEALNADVKVSAVVARVTAANVRRFVRSADVVVDCSDNFATKYLMNDACVLARRPLAHSGILGYSGQMMTIIPGKSACYRCVFPEPPPPGAVPSCREAGVLGAVAGLFGVLQAVEAVKIITGVGVPASNVILTGDVLGAEYRRIKIRKNPSCPVCGKRPSIKKPFDISQAACSHLPSTFHLSF